MSRGPIKVCRAIPSAHYEIYEIININKIRQNLAYFHKFIVEQNEKVEDDDSHVIPVSHYQTMACTQNLRLITNRLA